MGRARTVRPRAARAPATRKRKQKLSKAGARLIAGFEGFRSDLYDDAAGHCTIGYGHLVHHGSCDGSETPDFRKGVTRERALELLGEDAGSAAAAVNDTVTVALDQHQFDALVSFVFNVGTGAFRESTLLKLLNQGKYDDIPEQLDRWTKAGGRTLAGLVSRRKAEGDLFASGEAPQPADDGSMSTRDVQRALKEIGWPIKADGAWGGDTFKAVEDFQRGFGFWRLLIDGHAGPKTQEALKAAVAQDGKCSPHFTFAEFKSSGNGWIKVSRALVLGLEEYRDLIGGAVDVVSGYRDPQRNASVPGSAKNSQHMYGNAADLDPVKPTAEVKALRRFSGIGYQSSSGLVRHVDVRHVGPNTTRSSVRDPAIWIY
jgi:GH24 family phage-related lysozyme (muramidase)